MARASSRATACARSTRRTTVRGWKAWFANGSMTPARATAMIQGAAQLLRTSVISAAFAPRRVLQQRPEADADQRRQIRARDLRAHDRCARYSAGSSASADRARAASTPRLDGRVRLDAPGNRRRLSPPPRSRRWPRGSRRSAPASPHRSGRARPPAEVLERGGGVALLTLDAGELAIEERTVGRARNRRQVGLVRLVETTGLRRLARARQPLLHGAEPEDFDAARQIGLRRIGGNRRFERRQRVDLAVEAEQRLAAADQRRHVAVLRIQLQRPIEMRQRRLRILLRQLDVPQRGFGRIERRHRLSARRPAHAPRS